jgi:hypothetical protein
MMALFTIATANILIFLFNMVPREGIIRNHRYDVFVLSMVALVRTGLGCLNRFSASIGGAPAKVRLPSGVAAG